MHGHDICHRTAAAVAVDFDKNQAPHSPDLPFPFPMDTANRLAALPHARSATSRRQVARLSSFSHRQGSKVSSVNSRAKHRPLCTRSTRQISPGAESQQCFRATSTRKQSVQSPTHSQRTNPRQAHALAATVYHHSFYSTRSVNACRSV